MKLETRPAAAPLKGSLQPPGDKSVSHRAALLGAVAEGTTLVHGYLPGADTLATLSAVEHLGASIRRQGTRVEIDGGRLEPVEDPLDLGNSGTGLRLLAGLLAGQAHWGDRAVTLTGDASLCRRPMNRIVRPLQAMGGHVDSTEGRAPLTVHGRRLRGIDHRLEVASAQVKSAILLAGLGADGMTRVREPAPGRDHTERMLPAFGVGLETGPGGIGLTGGQSLRAAEIQVPGDLSAAAFALVAACLVADSEVVMEEVGLNPTRDGVLRILRAMGARLEIETLDRPGPEPVGRIRVRASELRGIEIPPDWVPLAIDEFPVIMAAAAAAEGETVIRGAGELRVKESDRIAAMCTALRDLGVDLEEREDGAVIRGGPVDGGHVDSAGDHRIAMSLAVLGLVARGPVEVSGAEWIDTSYPGFCGDLQALGAGVDALE